MNNCKLTMCHILLFFYILLSDNRRVFSSPYPFRAETIRLFIIMNNKILAIEKTMESIQEENRLLKNQISDYEKQRVNINIALTKQFQTELGIVKEEHRLLKKQLSEYEKQMTNINITVQKNFQSELGSIKEEKRIFKELLSDYEKQITNINLTFGQILEKQDNLLTEYKTYTWEIEDLHAASKLLKEKSLEYEKQICNINVTIKQMEQIFHKIEANITKGEIREINDISEENKVLKENMSNIEEELADINNTIYIPSPPRNLNAVLLDDVQVHLTWSKPEEIHGTLMGYRVIWGRKGESYQMLNLSAIRHSYISEVLDKDAIYEFIVNAKNEIGNGERASAVVTTPAGIPPHITLALKNQSVAEYQIISFVCKASGSPPPSFRWEREGKKIKTILNRFKVYDISHGSVLRIEPVRARDSTSFTCVAENKIGPPAKSTAHLRIYTIDKSKDFPQGYPRIVVSPELKSVEKYESVVMRCEADANNEDYSIEWLKNGRPVDLNDHRLKLILKGSLRIERTQESDYGKYECVASNHVGVAYSYAAMLYVRVRRVPPHFTIVPKREEVHPNGEVNLTCVAVGAPMPYVKWRYGAIELGKAVIGKNVLQLKNITESRSYTCVASSALGNIQHTGEVIVKG